MLYKTEGIVLTHIKYGESSIIARIFTKRFGIKSYIINGVRKIQPRHNIALLHNLSPVNMVVYNKKNANLQRISSIECARAMHHIICDIYKLSIATFLAELINKSTYADVKYELLFDFIKQSINELNEPNSVPSTFLLKFIINLSKHLGFGINNIQHVKEQLSTPYHSKYYLNQEEEKTLEMIIKNEPIPKIKRSIQKNITDCTIEFYKANISSLNKLKSLNIFKEIM
jgi:DNA repair protein RecO (recombination protein O)